MENEFMIENEILHLYAVNFAGGEDTEIAADLYANTFGWPILSKSTGHSELKIDGSLVLIFSKPTEVCPVTPGTLTLVTKNLNSLVKNFPQSFHLEKSSEKKDQYISALDPWHNRIWFYQKR